MSQKETTVTHEHQNPDAEASLGDVIESVWRQRGVLALSVLSTLGLGGLVLGVMLAITPSIEQHALDFRLRFTGVNEGTYPNGTPFQPGDIVAPSIVRPIYDRLELSRFVPFESFKARLSVVEASQQLDALRREYDAKLSNSKLSQAERDALEKEYESRRSASRSGEFRLSYLGQEESALPRSIVDTLLPAVLETWAHEAQSVKGAWLYNVPVPGQGVLAESDLASEDYLVVVDLLRLTAKRLETALAELSEIPGANLIRAAGKDGLSIIEVKARLDDLLQFKIEPLFAQVYGQGIFRDRAGTTRYLEHRLFRLGLDAKALDDKSRAIEKVLRELSALSSTSNTERQSMGDGAAQGSVVIPQFGDSFMDRLMEVGAQNADVEFRRELSQKIVILRHEMIEIEKEQNLYQALLKGFAAVPTNSEFKPSAPTQDRETTRADIEKRFGSLASATRDLIGQVQGLHRAISEQTLQPQNIYAVTGAIERVRSNPVGIRVVVGVTLASTMLGGLLGLLMVWARETHQLGWAKPNAQ